MIEIGIHQACALPGQEFIVEILLFSNITINAICRNDYVIIFPTEVLFEKEFETHLRAKILEEVLKFREGNNEKS